MSESDNLYATFDALHRPGNSNPQQYAKTVIASLKNLHDFNATALDPHGLVTGQRTHASMIKYLEAIASGKRQPGDRSGFLQEILEVGDSKPTISGPAR